MISINPSKVYVLFRERNNSHGAYVILSGSSLSLMKLGGLFSDLETGQLKNILAFHSVPLFEFISNIELSLEISDSPHGMKYYIKGKQTFLLWSVSNQHLRRFTNLVRVVAACKSPCHHYLDTDALDDVEVIVSIGEYDQVVEQLLKSKS